MASSIGSADVAASVRAELARAKISVRQLANELGVTHQSLSRRVSGAMHFRADELARIAAYLDVPIERLYGQPAPAKASA